MPNLFDNLNDDTRLGFALRESLRDFDTVDVATGYLDLRGWANFADILSTKTTGAGPAARVLVGMVAPADSEQLLHSLQEEVQPPAYGADIHDPETARARRDQLVAHLRTQLMRGLATWDGQRTLQTLKQQLSDGLVQMKVFTEKPLHGKTYIFHAPQKKHGARWAYVGSSNLTGAGLHSNLELNIDVQDSDATEKLAGWFEDRWNDPFSLTITDEIIQLIAESWADEDQPTPFEVYLKVCHSLAEDARDGMGYVLPNSLQKLLLDYQQTAVRTLARRVVRRGGTMLGDVVGLGKTLTAIATAAMLQAAEDYSTLVLCPKNLEQMWTEHLEAYDITGRVVRYSMADRVLPELKRFNLVICDESHNLRSSTTNAYQAIHDYIRRNSSKVLLLTATPYNLAFSDVANQIGLYLDDDDDLGIAPTAAMAADPNLINKVDGKITTLAAFRRSEEPTDWRRLMSDHLVRRTRSFIKRTAKTAEEINPETGEVIERQYLQFANGDRFFFPERISTPLSHDFSADDPAALMEDDTTLDAVANLILPRYQLADYDDSKAVHTETDTKIINDIRSGRGNVRGFVRISLFKRLSSSGHSFIASLRRQRARNELFIHAIDNQLPLPVGSLTDQQLNAAITDTDVETDPTTDPDAPAAEVGMHGTLASRYNHLRETLPARTRWVNSTIFKPALRSDLVHDNDKITMLLDRFGSWDSSHDSKINALVDLLRTEHPGEKVLIFTEYVDTADYVAEALKSAGIANVETATGETENPASVARRFSPESNQLPGQDQPEHAVEPEDPIDVLVATDVLSEGQNLQDCHIIVNYDLPWAIIRIIQRAGRVDRVGQKSETVHVYLITHERIERQIQLRQRIRSRLEANAEAFGSDEQFFGSDREVNLLDDLYSGRIPDDSDAGDDGEADAVSEAWLVWSNALERQPKITERVLGMQDMIYSTRDQYLHESRGSVTCYISTASGVDAFATSDTVGGQATERLLTPIEAMRIFQATPETPTAVMRPDHFDRQKALVHGPLKPETLAEGNLKGIRKWVWNRLGGTILAGRAEDAITALHERPLTEYATGRLTQARRNRYSEDDLIDLLNQLHAEDRLVIRSSDKDTIRIVCSIGVRDE